MRYIFIAFFMSFYLFWMLYLYMDQDYFEITDFHAKKELENYFDQNFLRKNIYYFIKEMSIKGAKCKELEVNPYNGKGHEHEFTYSCKYSTNIWWHFFHLQSKPYRAFNIMVYVNKDDEIYKIDPYCSLFDKIKA